MRSNRGFTLLEMAVVLAVIAILAAILTPIVTGYIDQARVTRANSDTKKIAQAVLLYKRDTSVFPGYAAYANGVAADSTVKACLTSDGTTPTAAQSAAYSATCTGSTGDLQVYVNLNTMGVFTNNATSEKIGGGTKFRGPYLSGLGGQDPWGTEYLVTSKNFSTPAGTTGNYAFAVSAGPNAQFDTTFVQPRATSAGGVAFVTSGDDITELIQ
jgi:prepilin-type N-terminal cleavage/methylation domain-containing protein